MGVEPTTSGATFRRSTVELRSQRKVKVSNLRPVSRGYGLATRPIASLATFQVEPPTMVHGPQIVHKRVLPVVQAVPVDHTGLEPVIDFQVRSGPPRRPCGSCRSVPVLQYRPSRNAGLSTFELYGPCAEDGGLDPHTLRYDPFSRRSGRACPVHLPCVASAGLEPATISLGSRSSVR